MVRPIRAGRPAAGGAAAPPETLEGSLERIVFSNPENGWSVVRLAVVGRREAVSAVGALAGGQPGERLRLTGAWEDDPKFGRQFRIATFETVAPTTLEGIERYLASGLIEGIGPVMAKRLVEAFGDDVPRGEVTDFYRAVKAEDGEGVVFSWIEWPDRVTRDEAWAKMMEDERMKPDPANTPFDGKRMFWGGFDLVFDTAAEGAQAPQRELA